MKKYTVYLVHFTTGEILQTLRFTNNVEIEAGEVLEILGHEYLTKDVTIMDYTDLCVTFVDCEPQNENNEG